MRIAGAGGLGTGLSAGRGERSTIWKRNPTTWWAGVSWTDADNPRITYAVELMGEMETRVSIGVEGRVGITKALSPSLSLTLYGAGSAFLAPFTMYGAGGGLMVLHDLGGWYLYGRVGILGYFDGSDLPEDSAMMKIDVAGGILLPLMEVGP